MSLIRGLWQQRKRGPFLAEEWPPFDPPKTARATPLTCHCPFVHGLCCTRCAKGAPANFCCGFRLGLRLCPLGRCLCMVSRLFASALVPVLQQRLSGKRSKSNRSEENHSHPVAEIKMDIGSSWVKGRAPCVLLGFQRGGSLHQRITPLIEAALDVRAFDDQSCHASLSSSRSFCSSRN